MRVTFFILLICVSTLVVSQYQDDFEDETLGNTPDLFSPALSGDVGNFILVDDGGDKRLRSNAGDLSSSLEYYLSISSEAIYEASWEFYVDLKFSTSGANYVDFFLVSDNSDLTSVQNGYFVRVGDTEDRIALFKIVDGTSTENDTPIITTADGLVNSSSSNPFVIQVTRDDMGNWELLVDEDATGSFASIGTAFDDDVLESFYFGLLIEQSSASSPANNHFFDDFDVQGSAYPDTTPPTIQSATAISDTEVDIQFSEPIDETSSQVTGNYAVDGSISITNASRDVSNSSLVHLTVDPLTNGSTYTLTVNNVEDENGNAIVADSQESFEYLVFEEAEALDVVINEFMADPNPVVTTLPDAEYVELYNRSNKYFNLENWTLDGDVLPAFTLAPNSYVLIVDDGNTGLFGSFSNVIDVTTLSLSNTGDDLIIVEDDNDLLIHSISFNGSEGGVSAELINPNGPDYSENNYGLSIDPDGGTPGEQNSIFDDTPDTSPPEINSVEVISNTELDVLFSEVVEEVSSETVDNYTIDGGISVISAAQGPSDNRLVHLVVDPLVSGELRTLTVDGVEDLSGNAISAGTIQFEYLETEEAIAGDVIINEFLSNPVDNNDDFIELLNVSEKFIDMAGWNISDGSSTSEDLASFVLRPGEYLIIYDEDAATDYSAFGNALTIASLSLNNADDQIEITSTTDVQIDFLAYGEQQEDGTSLELVNPNDPCRTLTSYSPSIAVFGSTPGTQNSVFDDTPDTTPPSISSYSFTNSLIINFSEVMDAESLTSGSYDVRAGLTISEIIVEGTFPTSVEITFNETIQSGDSYDIIIMDVLDCSGNALAETTISFALGRPPSFNELIITEIYADEDPSFGLPEREWIEIYNASEEVISTEGMNLTDATNTITLPSFNIEPNTYIILTSNTGESEFANAIGVSGYFSNSLSNSGETITLTYNSELIFSVTYTPNWHSANKDDGGYSLEMVDLTNPCLESGANWRSSTDVSGGTPGQENSVSNPGSVPDNMPPNLVRVTAISADTIRLVFDEKIDPISTQNASYNFNPGLEVTASFVLADKPKSIYVKLLSELEKDVPYTVEVLGISDCNGNEIDENELVFALPVVGENDEVKLSEILFNPRPNGVDFVEIYNDSEKYISLKNWHIARLVEEVVDEKREISEEELVIGPGNYLVFTSDTDILFNNYPKAQSENFIEISLPSYNDDEGTVLILDPNDEIRDEFSYSEDYHYNLLESVDGVSLERVSFSQPNNGDNWRSAASTEGFATPGYENSQSFKPDTQAGKVTADPEVFIPGNAGSGRDFTTINYQLDQPGKFANVNIYDQSGRLIKNLAQGALLSTTGFLRWDGDTNGGKMARMGYYLILFEIYDSNGTSETIKETVVVGRDF